MLTEQSFIKGDLYKIVLRSDFDSDVKEKYKYYYYLGLMQLDGWNPFHCFMPKIKKYQKNKLAVFVKDSSLSNFDYEYDNGKTTNSYYFITDCYIDKKLGQIVGVPLKPVNDDSDTDLYGYDTIHLNVYPTVNK